MTDETLAERYVWYRIGCGRRLHAMREEGCLWTLCGITGTKRAARLGERAACERCMRKIEEANRE